jgi:prepilin-type N-terminal cleavage/methylation domain-containing protein
VPFVAIAAAASARPPVATLRKVSGLRHQHGFTLAETLVALALVTLAMLVCLTFFWEQPRILERLDARQQATQAIEATLEGLRGGVLPLRSGVVQWPVPPPAEIWEDELFIWLHVTPTETPDLFVVGVTAHYKIMTARQRVRDEHYEKTVETMVWSPP